MKRFAKIVNDFYLILDAWQGSEHAFVIKEVYSP